MTFHDAPMTMPVAAIDCPLASAGMVTLTYNGVMHVTNDSSGGIHLTFTATGNFTFTPGTFNDGIFVPNPSGLMFTGHATFWFGGNLASSGTTVFSSTFSAHGVGTDGSTFGFNGVMHVTFNPDGTPTGAVMNLVCH